MINRLLTPHTARDIKGFWFYMISNPDVIMDQQDLAEYELIQTSTWDESDVGDPPYGPTYSEESITLDDGSVNRYTVLNLTWYWREWAEENMVGKCQTIPEGDDGYWNVIVPYMVNSNGDEVAVSINYWNDPIPLDAPRFNKLEMTYLSATTIVVSSAVIDITGDYREHIRDEAIRTSTQSNGGDSANTSSFHPHLDGKMVKELANREDSYWTDSFGSIAPQELNGTTDTENDIFNSKISGEFSYRVIPDGKGKLITSPWIGAGWYNPDSQTITTTATWNNVPKPPKEGNYEFYMYMSEVAVFYYPETYEMYVSCTLGEGKWETPWKVGGESLDEAGNCIVHCVVPSYFDIIPFIFVNVEVSEGSEWRIYPLRSLSSNLREGERVTGAQSAVSWSSYNNLTQTGKYFDIEDFLEMSDIYASREIFTVFLYNETFGTNLRTDPNLLKYLTSQIAISYMTFVQGMRYFGDRNIQILDCGIVARKQGEDDIFMPYSVLNEMDGIGMVSFLHLPENSVIDNMLYYSNGEIKSINTEDALDVTQYEDVQMHHGIVVGKTGDTYTSIL